MTLAAYMTGRAIICHSIDCEQLPTLRKANDTVNEARSLLSLGRSNVYQHLEQSQEPFWRNTFKRLVTKNHPDTAYKTAMAIYMKTGNCGEHSQVTTALHAGKLTKGESIQAVSGRNLDHAWSEMPQRNGDRLVIDAWATGPAILSEDSRFSTSKEARRVTRSLNGGDEARQFADKVRQHTENIKKDNNIAKKWRNFHQQAKQKKMTLDESHTWSLTPVLSDKFKTKVHTRHERSHVQQTLRNNQMVVRSGITQRLALAKEIAAVGSARALGANIQEALEKKDEILQILERDILGK